MMEGLIAVAAVTVTSIQLVPQTITAIKDKDLSHISKSTYIMTCISALLWLAHGSNIRDAAIIFANIVIFSCAATILYMKMKKTGHQGKAVHRKISGSVRRRR